MTVYVCVCVFGVLDAVKLRTLAFLPFQMTHDIAIETMKYPVITMDSGWCAQHTHTHKHVVLQHAPTFNRTQTGHICKETRYIFTQEFNSILARHNGNRLLYTWFTAIAIYIAWNSTRVHIGLFSTAKTQAGEKARSERQSEDKK